MMRLVTQAWWSVAASGVCGTMMLAVACGGSESPQTQRETPSQTQAQAPVQTPAKVTEKVFVSGGKIDMQLDGGSYIVRPSGGNAVRVTLGGNVGATKVDVATEGTHANVLVKETPRNNFQATIEVPQSADLV